MSVASLLFVFMTYHPLVADSLIFAVDIENMEATEQAMPGFIIDYCVDDFLYVLTGHALYKIDRTSLTIEDNIPLPQRFNYLVVDNTDVILMTTNEIIIIDKRNLAFKRGIGIEYGDYRPITVLHRTSAGKLYSDIYLIVDYGRKSVLKMFDLNSGKLRRKLTVDKIVSSCYDHTSNRLIALNVNHRLTIYDANLKKKSSFELKFDATWFSTFRHGYIVHSPRGIFFVNPKGKVIDFQPITFEITNMNDKFTFIGKGGITFLDSLTLRPKGYLNDDHGIKKIQTIQSPDGQYAIAVDTHYNLYAIDVATMELQSMPVKKAIAKEAALRVPARTDSLWYFQLGAFANYENAVEMYTDAKDNIPVFIDSLGFYRVIFGGFQNRMDAIEIIDKINLDGWFLFHKKIEQTETVRFSVDTENYILEDGIIKKE